MRVDVCVKCNDGGVRCLSAKSADYIGMDWKTQKLKIHLSCENGDTNADKRTFKGVDKRGSKDVFLIHVAMRDLVSVETEE